MELSQLAVPSVYLLIFFLSYSSQWLLLHLDPEPLKRDELIRFNILLVCLLITYTRSVFVDSGGISGTELRKELDGDGRGDQSQKELEEEEKAKKSRKWCRRCKAVKPPRAHHCRTCKRCIPKMDHHCPWTANCVSHTTFPHFLRFLLYAVLSMTYLSNLLFPRLHHLWTLRNMPSYLGPTLLQLSHLFLLTTLNSLVLFALAILLIRNLYALAVNTTTIEGWEIERHETLLRRARVFGGILEGPDGVSVRITRQEFPYDVGIWANVKQGMGTANPINMLNPLAGTPRLMGKLTYPTNGFSDLPWPPPDPDRTYYRNGGGGSAARGPEEGFTYRDAGLSNEETVAAFRQRQRDDEVRRRRPFVERLEEEKRRRERLGEGRSYYNDDEEDVDEEVQEVEELEEKRREVGEGEESWRNAEGERLRDFGVDEDAEFYDEAGDGGDGEDDVPLSELLARKRRAAAAAATG